MQRHRFDPISALFGVLFVIAALTRLIDVDLPIPWGPMAAIAVVGAGMSLLVSALRRESGDR